LGRYTLLVLGIEIILALGAGWLIGSLLEVASAAFPFGSTKVLTKREKTRGRLIVALFVAAVLFTADGVILALPDLHAGYVVLKSWLGLRLTTLAIVAAVFGFGWLAYKFKEKKPVAYGLVEVLFALFSATIAARQMTSDWTAPVLALVGAMYIVSRGFNNMAGVKT
jgi:hypothetical protein